MKFKKSISMILTLTIVITILPLTFPSSNVRAASQLIVNGSFETLASGGNTNYWNNPSAIAASWNASTMPSQPAANSPKISVVNDNVHSGYNALKIAPTDDTLKNNTRLFLGQVINLPAEAAGKKYRASAWVKLGNIAGNSIGLRFQKFTGANATGTQIISSDQKRIGTMGWTQINNDQIIDDNCQSVKVSIIHGTDAPTQGTLWVDDISFQEVIDSIILPESSISLSIGNKFTLSPDFMPKAATKDITWTSSDSTVATVDNAGIISAIKVGKCRITGISIVDSSKAVYCDVNVVGVPVERIILDKSSINIDMGTVSSISAEIEPQNASEKGILWSSDNTAVATVDENGLITGIKPGTANIIAQSASDSSKKALCTISVSGLILDKASSVINEGKYTLLTAATMPGTKIIWKSSSEDIATVTDGLVKGISSGNTVITAITEDNKYSASMNLTVEPYTMDEYDNLRIKYASTLLGGISYDLNDPSTQTFISNIATSAQTYWSSMDSTGNYLWNDIPGIIIGGPKRKTSEVTANYNRLMTMTKAYLMEGSNLKGNTELLRDILRGLDWLNQNLYNSNTKLSMFVGDNGTGDGNWYAFVIGTPKVLNNLVSLLYDYLNSDEINRYEMAVRNFVSDPTWYMDSYGKRVTSTGGNLSDTCKVAVVNGINTKDAQFIAAGRDALSGNFNIVTSGEGIYSDGSFIQHSFVPYNNTYGQVLLQGIGDIVYILDESTWQVKDTKIDNIYNWIETGIAPLLYKGAAMDMASGRAISRGGYQDHEIGASLINIFIQFSQFAPEPYANRYKSLAKYMIQQDTYRDYINNCSDIILKSQALRILNDLSIEPSGELVGQFNYPNMDRVVHRNSNYSLAISMYSKRISNYETMNGENLKGWHTSDGMTYLYNGDITNFSSDYWATVDPYRLPGTTVDKLPQPTAANDQSASKITSPQGWVGGTSLGGYGTAGMFLDKLKMDPAGVITNKLNMNLQAKKSWFMFGNEVVALGAGITSTDNRTIETIIDNRKISDIGDNRVTINGITKLDALGESEVVPEASWMHLEGKTANSDVGYYFPGGANINILKEARTGSWADININGNRTPITRNYVTAWFDHGLNPYNSGYSYVLLPGMSAKEVEQYAKNSDIEIVSNTPEVQAARKKSLNMLAANFWNDAIQTVDYITVNKKASVLSQMDNGYLDLSISDPTKENNATIEVDINEPYLVPEKLDSRIKVLSSGDKTCISIDVSNSEGKAIIGRFKRMANTIELDKTNLYIKVGDSTLLKANIMPSDAVNKELIWKSSDNRIVEVDSNGYVKALKKGSAYITVTLKDGNLIASCEVNVIKPKKINVPNNRRGYKIILNKDKKIDLPFNLILDEIPWLHYGKNINNEAKK
ncbi:Ig-like domain-containing protein [Clostridium swellfunianum]|uniref:polysaccharide lyase family 8 super-sandwich domain-containing protein n=1 Tax=Clostridium swellfunianum TaxID=1367462 RepID=UPI00202E87E9|nr:polysaccharide lyase family 8 super-sandwich domain-containing protein [Clostridium swellfunianum]MCM0649609.1 Ig-like domain-containing protein [Clostridium swellfunianum]